MNFDKIKEKIIDFLFIKKEIRKYDVDEDQETEPLRQLEVLNLDNFLEDDQEINKPEPTVLPKKEEKIETLMPKETQLPSVEKTPKPVINQEKREDISINKAETPTINKTLKPRLTPAPTPTVEQAKPELPKIASVQPQITKKPEPMPTIKPSVEPKPTPKPAETPKPTEVPKPQEKTVKDNKDISGKEKKEIQPEKKQEEIAKDDKTIFEKEKQRIMNTSHLTEEEKKEIIDELYENFKKYESDK
ncbi:MAG: hypothetical protein IKF82_01865 [Bacilli bacterium]|nr:hypothetical protein [Bacilli bacterium]